jgi:hypothetical protein
VQVQYSNFVQVQHDAINICMQAARSLSEQPVLYVHVTLPSTESLEESVQHAEVIKNFVTATGSKLRTYISN